MTSEWTTKRDEWEAPDGSVWVQHPELNEWSGWIPGEDGCWHLTDDEFRKWFPEKSSEQPPEESK